MLCNSRQKIKNGRPLTAGYRPTECILLCQTRFSFIPCYISLIVSAVLRQEHLSSGEWKCCDVLGSLVLDIVFLLSLKSLLLFLF